MKTHTSQFKNAIKEFGREIDSKITYTLDNEEIELGSEELNSITPHYEGAILKSVMKQLDIDSNVEIPIGTILRYQFGVKVGNEYEYIDYGNYVVYSVEKQEDTYSYKITCYDKMLYAMKDYENSNITFPITIKDYLEAICEKVGLEYEGSQFANSDKVIDNELYLDNEGRSLEYTFRDVLDEIAQVSGGTICINNEDKLEVRYIHDVGELQTLTGSSLTLETDDAIKLDSFELEGNTTQETRSGINLLNVTATSTTGASGISFVVNNDKSITVNGTNASSSTYFFRLAPNFTLPAGTYTLSGGNSNAKNYLFAFYDDKQNFQGYSNIITQTFSSSVEIAPYIRVGGNQTINNQTIYPMIVKGSYTEQTLPTYEQYGVQPSPNYPSELVSVGYTNLFNSELEQGTIQSSNGQDQSATNRVRTINYIDVDSSTQYTINGATSLTKTIQTFVFEYQNDTTYIQRIPSAWTNLPYTFTTSANTKKIRIVFAYSDSSTTNVSEFSNVQLEKGTKAHSYISYGKYGIEIETQGKNLLNIAKTQIGKAWNNTSNTARAIVLTKVKPSTTYTISFDDLSGLDGMYWFDRINETDNTYVSGNMPITQTTTITTRANVNWLGIQFNKTNITQSDVETVKLQIEKGTQATTYEEYKSNTYLYTLDNPLRSIGNVKDLLYIKNGMLYVDRKIGQLILSGSESWAKQSTWSSLGNNTNAFYYAKPSVMVGGYNGKMLSSHFVFVPDVQNYDREGIYSSANLIIRVPKAISTVVELKTWLSTHNTEVQYLLNEPYTEELGQVDMPSTYDGITYLDAPNTTNVSYISEFEEIDEEYLKDVNVNFGEKFGAVNTIVLSRGGDGDKIGLSIPSNLADEDKIAIQITDNQIMNGNNRADFMQPILSQLYGLEYYINDFSSTGICYLDLCDRYRIKIGDNSYKCIMFNNEVDITQGLEELIYTDMQEENEQEYKYIGSTDRGITQANIIANKADATISSFTQQLDETNNRLNSVEVKQTATDETINIISTNIDANGNITEVTTTTGFTFNAEGMTIADSSTNFSALHRNDGTYYYDGDTITGQYTKDGSKQKDLELFGVYYYGKNDINDDPMFVAQLYTDENGEEAFGHFLNKDI